MPPPAAVWSVAANSGLESAFRAERPRTNWSYGRRFRAETRPDPTITRSPAAFVKNSAAAQPARAARVRQPASFVEMSLPATVW
jgi:hypothetical protein